MRTINFYFSLMLGKTYFRSLFAWRSVSKAKKVRRLALPP